MFKQAVEILARWIKTQNAPEPNRLDVSLDSADLIPAVTALRDARWGYLSAITGLDLGAEAGELEVLYHFCAGANVLTLRVRIPRDAAVISSLRGVIPSAQLYERELREMFGINVAGLPDDGYLFLPDDWSKEVYPLRKDAAIR